jgi:hypothetical protein
MLARRNISGRQRREVHLYQKGQEVGMECDEANIACDNYNHNDNPS